MQIKSVKCHLMTVDLAKNAFSWPGGSLRYWTTALAEILTDDGMRGLGECYIGVSAPRPAAALIEQFGELLIGQNPLDIPFLLERMRSKSLFWAKAGLPLAVIGVLENALWDIAGQASSAPVWRLLGGLAHQKLPVYASGGLDSTETGLARELEGYREKGFRAVKIRIGSSLKNDVAKVQFARKILGGEIELMVDAVMGHHPRPWSGKEALEHARALEEFQLAWFEEPCGNLDYAGYAFVRAHSKIPVAGGESATGVQEHLRFLDADALDWIQPDAAHAGGILECKAVSVLAQARGVRTAYHSWGAAPCLWANYHLAFSDPNARYLEFPTHGLPLIEELSVEPFKIVNGCMSAPATPGLGVQLTAEVLNRYPHRPGTHFWP